MAVKRNRINIEVTPSTGPERDRHDPARKDAAVMSLARLIARQIAREQDNPFNKISLQEEKAARPAYSIQFLKEKWLKGTPSSSRDESLHILYAIMNTGTGPKEICGLEPQAIHLDHEVPHIDIKPNKIRKLKTGNRGRQIPLIGQSLIAFKKYPHGLLPSARL